MAPTDQTSINALEILRVFLKREHLLSTKLLKHPALSSLICSSQTQQSLSITSTHPLAVSASHAPFNDIDPIYWMQEACTCVSSPNLTFMNSPDGGIILTFLRFKKMKYGLLVIGSRRVRTRYCLPSNPLSKNHTKELPKCKKYQSKEGPRCVLWKEAHPGIFILRPSCPQERGPLSARRCPRC